jgi:hypothetical protein
MKFTSPLQPAGLKSISVWTFHPICSPSKWTQRWSSSHNGQDDVIIVHFGLDNSNRFQNPVWSFQQDQGWAGWTSITCFRTVINLSRSERNKKNVEIKRRAGGENVHVRSWEIMKFTIPEHSSCLGSFSEIWDFVFLFVFFLFLRFFLLLAGPVTRVMTQVFVSLFPISISCVQESTA